MFTNVLWTRAPEIGGGGGGEKLLKLPPPGVAPHAIFFRHFPEQHQSAIFHTRNILPSSRNFLTNTARKPATDWGTYSTTRFACLPPTLYLCPSSGVKRLPPRPRPASLQLRASSAALGRVLTFPPRTWPLEEVKIPPVLKFVSCSWLFSELTKWYFYSIFSQLLYFFRMTRLKHRCNHSCYPLQANKKSRTWMLRYSI